MDTRTRARIAFFLLVVFASSQALGAVGKTAGSADVSQTGEAGYPIPIFAPPGTHGMTPQLVNIDSKATGAPRTMLSNETLRKAVEARLGPNQNLARFWPDLAAWLCDGALVTVRIQTLIGNAGPLTERCLGFLASTVRENQITAISDTDLKKKYKASCRGNER